MVLGRIPRLVVGMAVTLISVSATRVPAQCLQEQKLTASDAERADHFGQRVSTDGNTVVVGAESEDCPDQPGSDCGAAYVYQFDGSNWVEQKLTASTRAADDLFGRAVSVSGNTMIVGARVDCAAEHKCGVAYVYNYNGASWIETQTLTTPDPLIPGGFGFTVSVSGDEAIIGASGEDCAAGVLCGAAYMFRFDGSAWVHEQRLTASDAAQGDFFGISVSVSEGIAVVGAYNDDCSEDINDDCGSAYVYRFDGNSWVEEQKLVAADTDTLKWFGLSVSVSGDTALIGVFFSDCDAGVNCGSAHIFQYNGTSWVEQKLTASDADVSDHFGSVVSVSGNTAVVGAFEDNCAVGGSCGSAYIFRFNGSSWVEDQKITASDAGPTDTFGIAVAISEETVVVGAHNDNCSAGLLCGSAYVFDCPNCGDGYMDPGEECDGGLACTDCLCDAGFETTDPLSMNCQSICGNGGIDPNEQCDDGNTVSGDGCDSSCIIEFGACCLGTACNLSTRSDCENAAGNFFGFNTTCDSPDGDNDGLRDQCDECPSDSNKIEPGICGCGRDDIADSDNDGVTDCIDQCEGVDDAIFAPECAQAIPAISEWGMIVMTLLLLTGIKVSGLGGQQPQEG